MVNRVSFWVGMFLLVGFSTFSCCAMMDSNDEKETYNEDYAQYLKTQKTIAKNMLERLKQDAEKVSEDDEQVSTLEAFKQWIAELQQTEAYKIVKYVLGSATVLALASWVWTFAQNDCAGNSPVFICPVVAGVPKEVMWLFVGVATYAQPYVMPAFNIFAEHAIKFIKKSKDFIHKQVPFFCPAPEPMS